MSARNLAVRLAALKALKDHIGQLYEAARVEALEQMDAGDRKSARLADGTSIGTVSVTDPQPKPKARVTDDKAFLRWVQETRPDEVVPVVRSSYKARVLKRIEDAETVIDEATGEILADGVEFGYETAESYARCDQTEAQASALVAAWQSGDLVVDLPGMPELPKGGTE